MKLTIPLAITLFLLIFSATAAALFIVVWIIGKVLSIKINQTLAYAGIVPVDAEAEDIEREDKED